MKDSLNKEIKAQMLYMRNKYLQDNASITDKDCAILSNLFYQRDKSSDTDIEMMQVQRGLNWGLLLMRQIIEGTNLDDNER